MEVETVLFVDEPSRNCNLEMTELSISTLPGGRMDCAVAFATQDLQEDKNTGRDERRSVDEELRPILWQPVSHTALVRIQAGGATYEGEVQVQVHLSAARVGKLEMHSHLNGQAVGEDQ